MSVGEVEKYCRNGVVDDDGTLDRHMHSYGNVHDGIVLQEVVKVVEEDYTPSLWWCL